MEEEYFILEYASLIQQDAHSAKFQLHDSIGRTAVYKGNLLNRNIKISQKVAVCAELDGANSVLVTKVITNEFQHNQGTVDYVNRTFGYIKRKNSEQLVTFFRRNVRHPSNLVDLRTILNVGDRVQFCAIALTLYDKCQLRAVRVELLTPPHPEREIAQIRNPIATLAKQEILDQEEGIIIAKCSTWLYMWCRDLGLVFCPLSELTWTHGLITDHELGTWLTFTPEEQEECKGCSWIARKAAVANHNDHVKVNGRDIKIESCYGVVGNVLTVNCLAWNDKVGKVIIKKENAGDLWPLKPLTIVQFDIDYVAFPISNDIRWQGKNIRLANKAVSPIVSWKEEKAKFEAVMYNKYLLCASLRLSNNELAFLCNLSYYKHMTNAREFSQDLRNHQYFHVLIVPNQKKHKSKWNVLFAQPWEFKEKEHVALSSESSAKDDLIDFDQELEEELQIKSTSDCETQTTGEIMIERKLLQSIREDSVIWNIVKTNHKALLLAITALCKGSHRYLRFLPWKPDINNTASCDSSKFTETKTHKAVQTSVIHEKVILEELRNDTHFIEAVEESMSEEWIEYLTSFHS